MEKACQDAIKTSAEEEADLLQDESFDPRAESLPFCEKNLHEQGSDRAKQLYARSLLLSGDRIQSRALIEQLAADGEPYANLVLGFLYSDFKERVPVEAITHFVKALVAGDPHGAYGLGKYFELGMHDLPDYTQAAAMYSLVADDVPEAKFRLAQLYQYGLGVQRDESSAVKMLRSAASSGYRPAVDALRLLNEKKP